MRDLVEKFWIGVPYVPPRWMRREAYYKAKRLNKLRYNKTWSKAFTGEIGFYDSVRFVEEA